MIHDALLLFSDAQAVTADAKSTSSVDLDSAGINIGVGENLYIVVSCDVAMTDAGSTSYTTVSLVTDDNAAMTSATAVQTLGVFAALSPIGTQIIARIQPGTFERYIALSYVSTNGDLTTGSFTAFITHDVSQYTSYADNITIS